MIAQLIEVALSCETQKSSCNDATKHCNIICELPPAVDCNDLLKVERATGISIDEIKSTKSLLSIKGERMPENLPENIGNTEANFTTFQRFSVTYSKLKFIKQTDFNYMTVITELDLSNNQIEIVPNGVFDNLVQLEILFIHNNKLAYLPTDTLAMLIRLKHFYAQDNQLKQLNKNFFSNNKQIERILLQNNRLARIDEHFIQFTDLGMVDLRGNNDFCECKVMDPDESQRKKQLCENDRIPLEVDWKDKFKNCSRNRALILWNAITVGPCALNEAIRMYNAQLQFEICVWDHEEEMKLPNDVAVANCTIPRRIEEQDIWREFDTCVLKETENNDQLKLLLQICYSARNSTVNDLDAVFNSCIMCTKLNDSRNVEKCKLRYIKDNGDDINDFQSKVSTYFGNPTESYL